MAPAAAAVVFSGKSMAVPAISFLINKAFTYLHDYFKAEGMGDVKNRLLLALPKIQAVFDVVNPEHIKERSSALDAWLWQLRDAVQEAEDAIDELEYYELEEKAKDRKVSDWGSSFAKMKRKAVKSVKHASVLNKTVKRITHHGTLKRLRKALERLDRTATGVENFLMLADRLKGLASNSQQHEELINKDRETGSMLTATQVFGRDKEKELIVGWLTKKTSDGEAEIVVSTNHVSIVSIVGHGGMGKTTLAQLIRKEDQVLKHFDKVIWVCVSTSFDAKAVICKLLESATWAKPTVDTLEALQQILKEKLEGSDKVLLILDDVWEDKKIDQWEKLFTPLRSGKSGSKILLTTRMKSVEEMATNVMGGERECLALCGLEEHDNLRLFNYHFARLQKYAGLQSTGEQIAKKLGGCPLVTKVVCGHLRANMTYQYWNRFLHEELEHFEGSADDIMNVLKLSYYHLPTELQICFRYCSIFPQDHRFKKENLVKMWVCSGLISQAAGDTQRPEEIAEEYLSRLTRKSFFDRCGGDSEEYYAMHDLMHDMATWVSSGECARMTDVASSKNVMSTVRHLSIKGISCIPVEEVKKISCLKNLRTIIIEYLYEEYKDIFVYTIEKIVESSTSLRLLSSEMRHTSNFPDKLANLKHLRYIRLDNLSVEGIREISKLYHLIVGDFKNFRAFLFISGEQEPKHLRHLGYLDRLQYMKYGSYGFGHFPVGRLTSLQNLQCYCVGQNGCRMSALRDLRSLRELQVLGLENIESQEEAKDAKLKEKQYLRRLSLYWSECNSARSRTEDLILDLLEPHANLQDLTISGYDGVRLPIWITNFSVKNLVTLKLEKCINWEHLPSLGELLLLKRLELVKLTRLKQLGTCQSFRASGCSCIDLSLPPSLRDLYIRNCIHLECASLLFEKMNELETLQIIDCPNLTMPIKGGGILLPLSLKNLDIGHCGNLECPLLDSMRGLTNLGMLHLKNCLNLTSLPSGEVWRSLKSLQYLIIRRCENLSSLGGLGLLPSTLQQLIIKSCSKLIEVASSLSPNASGSNESEGDPAVPSSLEIRLLHIDLSYLLLLEPLKSLCHTNRLTIRDGSEMKNLPQQWLRQNHTSLQSLTIRNAKSLESLPPSMQHLYSLDELHLWNASHLRSLPDLPSSLKKLIINGCDSGLQKRSRKRGSSEWNKISHIPRVIIGHSYFMMGKECSREAFWR